MKTMKTYLKYPENTAFIICRIVFRHGRRQEKHGLHKKDLGLAGAEEEKWVKNNENFRHELNLHAVVTKGLGIME